MNSFENPSALDNEIAKSETSLNNLLHFHYASENPAPLIDQETENDLKHMQFADLVHKLLIPKQNRDQASWEAIYLAHEFALQIGNMAGAPKENVELRDFARDLLDHPKDNIENIASRFLDTNEHVADLVDLYMDDIDQSRRYPHLVATMAGYTFFMLAQSQPDSELHQFRESIEDWKNDSDSTN